MELKSHQLTIDIFCRVVDNYGDIGICWRLAQQLAAEHSAIIRLIVDDLVTFKKLEPRIDPALPLQTIGAITVMRWQDSVLEKFYSLPADTVIEAFACTLPDLVVTRMRARSRPPVWIDFEYLTAEDWIDACHAVPSLHPQTGIPKTLFFPGFSAQSGGLVRERDLIRQRDEFQASPDLQNQWRADHGLPSKDAKIDVSVFCYPDAPYEFLLHADPEKFRFFLPENMLPDLAGDQFIRFAWLNQADYDRLLWACDLNFVRGEDSWVRAQWAAKPLIWQPYKQEKAVHLDKLAAFLSRYSKGLETTCAETLADLYAMWNEGAREGKTASRLWDSLLPLLPHLTDHARAWSASQASQEDCATNLIRFIRTQKNN